MGTLEILTGALAGRWYELSGDQTVVGRYPFCDIVLPSHTISRQHTRIVRTAEGYYIEDLNSLNGTYVNGRRIDGRLRLNDRDRINIFEIEMSFHEAMPELSFQDEDVKPFEEVQAQPDEALLDTIMEPPALDQTASADALAAEQAQAKLRAVLDITRSLGGSLDANEMLPNILSGLFDIFPQAERGYILLAEEPDGQLAPRAVMSRHPHTEDTRTLQPISRKVAQQVMSDARPLLISDGDPAADEAESVLEPQVHSMMCAPLMGPSRKPLGIIHLDAVDPESRFFSDDLDVLVSVATVAGQAVEYAQAHKASLRLDRRERDLATAKKLQLQFLPHRRPRVPGYRFFDHYRAAYEVGGDYFGYVPLPNGRLAVAVGDVAGKGVAAALLMAQLCSEVRFCLATSHTPAEAVGRLNRELASTRMDDRFVTFLLCVLDPVRHTVTMVNAGHMPPLCRRADGRVEELGLVEQGLPIGFEPQRSYQQCEVPLEAGELIMLYTDGISEAMNADGQVYGSDQVRDVLVTGPKDLHELGQYLLADIARFTEGRRQNDDICLLAFAREAG